MFWKKRELSTDYVELSIGRVDYNKLTWKEINDAYKKSTVIKDVINNAFFLDCVENSIVNLSKQDREKLSVEDGLKMREKTKEILYRYGILKETKTQVVTTTDDQSLLDEQYRRIQETIKNARGNHGSYRDTRG